jgi:TonB-linked SusC/RagA family outer membrane protein
MKKKQDFLSLNQGRWLLKLRKMKLTAILSFLVLVSFGNSYSQVKLSLSFEKTGIREVITTLEEKTNYIFLYKDEIFDFSKTISADFKDASFEEVLQSFCDQTNVDYEVRERQIILKEKPVQAVRALELQQPQRREITGTVRDNRGQPLPGVAVVVKGTTIGAVTSNNGNFQLSIPADAQILEFSFVGMKRQEVSALERSIFEIVLEDETYGVDEVVVVGYGTQKRSDITGTVASLGKERLEMVPNLNIAQAIQGSIPGIMINQTNSGASPSESIMIRGRNSIRADNTPLIVVDGIPYSGAIRDLSPNDVQSIEILKDASAAAIYGSRGSNGVILITTKEGVTGVSKISYDGYYSMQTFAFLPDYMDGKEFYDFKMIRYPGAMTASERKLYESGIETDWPSLGLRNGATHQHTLSVSGGSNTTKYFVSGNLLDVRGLAINDNYKRLTTRINIDTKIAKWLTIGSRTQLTYDDRSGLGPDMSDLFQTNPLTKAYEEDGSMAIYIWDDDKYFGNPLQMTLYDNINESFQVISNNYAVVDVPFIQGLSYRINTGIRVRFTDEATYRGRNTKIGLEAGGSAETNRSRFNNTVIENILSYSRTMGVHNIFGTAVYSYEGSSFSSNRLTARGFPHDFLKWYSSAQAELATPAYSFDETVLMSQMLRLNYSYDSRYLLTLTGRRDGFSGFGANTKWGAFPSVALGWNIHNEDFFKWKELFSELKFRASYGLNGNQAVGSYESISRLSEYNMVADKQTVAGYIPSRLGQENLGWESSKTLNLGLDFAIFKSRISGDINLFKTNTTDLLLNRSISAIHGITSITQNIGETENKGIEISLQSRNIVKPNFRWYTSGNLAYGINKIVSLYGQLDDQGVEIDDVANKWFIGQPIRVNYDFYWEGTWQSDEADQAAKYGTKPGFVKLQDVNKDDKLDAIDRQILGQQDPKLLWGLTNSFSYKNFNLDIFVHGVHGVTKVNPLLSDYVWADVRRNTIKKNWWTPENPTNEWIINHLQGEWMSGIQGVIYEDASFMRVKDISLSYDIPQDILNKFSVDKLRFYVTGRNLATITNWRGLDPELSGQRQTPLQREFVIGLNLEF